MDGLMLEPEQVGSESDDLPFSPDSPPRPAFPDTEASELEVFFI